jgi:hypothetical protein
VARGGQGKQGEAGEQVGSDSSLLCSTCSTSNQIHTGPSSCRKLLGPVEQLSALRLELHQLALVHTLCGDGNILMESMHTPTCHLIGPHQKGVAQAEGKEA